MRFRNRRRAGERLAEALDHLRGGDVVVLALPRGGVPVAVPVAEALGAPLDVVLVRKLGVPDQPELAMGAIGEGGVRVLNDDVISLAHVTDAEIESVSAIERDELERRARRYRGDRAPIEVTGRVVVVIDDGLATGATARAAVQVVRHHGPARLVLAVPVAPTGTDERFAGLVDELVVLETPAYFGAVGAWYRNFDPVPDRAVVEALQGAGPRPEAASRPLRREVLVPLDDAELVGDLHVPEGAIGLVLFAHGSGSSRASPRNRQVASTLRQSGVGTFLFDLLTPGEAHDRRLVFDVELLADRLARTADWIREQEVVGPLHQAYFGASTGAAAALAAAARPGASVAAIVSRGGRPDLAGDHLPLVEAPTLLVVGGRDGTVLDLNRQAAERLRCEHELVVVPGATHLFEEPGALGEVARLASGWFVRHLRRA